MKEDDVAIGYHIHAGDVYHAAFYLTNRLRSHDLEFANGIDPSAARLDFWKATEIKSTTQQAEQLDAWATEHLNPDEWK